MLIKNTLPNAQPEEKTLVNTLTPFPFPEI